MTRPTTGGPRQRRRRLLTLAIVLGASVSLLPRGSSATVEEQRARLPPPAECPDKVEGTWAALVYTAHQRMWYDYTLVIRRSAPDGGSSGALEGEMTSHFWSGGPTEDKPPTCAPGGHELTVKMPGKGMVDAVGNVVFGSKTYTVDSITCGGPAHYNPDNFSGKIDSAIQEFQSVNNDGGAAVNEPAVFRRIRCRNAPGRTQSKAPPPAFAPPKRSSWRCGK